LLNPAQKPLRLSGYIRLQGVVLHSRKQLIHELGTPMDT
jgi:hypothetical protein